MNEPQLSNARKLAAVPFTCLCEPRLLDAQFTEAMNTHDRFKNSEFRMPFNRV